MKHGSPIGGFSREGFDQAGARAVTSEAMIMKSAPRSVDRKLPKSKSFPGESGKPRDTQERMPRWRSEMSCGGQELWQAWRYFIIVSYRNSEKI